MAGDISVQQRKKDLRWGNPSDVSCMDTVVSLFRIFFAMEDHCPVYPVSGNGFFGKAKAAGLYIVIKTNGSVSRPEKHFPQEVSQLPADMGVVHRVLQISVAAEFYPYLPMLCTG